MTKELKWWLHPHVMSRHAYCGSETYDAVHAMMRQIATYREALQKIVKLSESARSGQEDWEHGFSEGLDVAAAVAEEALK